MMTNWANALIPFSEIVDHCEDGFAFLTDYGCRLQLAGYLFDFGYTMQGVECVLLIRD